MPDEPKKKYKVKPGMVWGHNPAYKEGDEVELTEKEAAGFLDMLEDVEADLEADLEAETGHDFEQTGDNPPTLAETDKPAPKVPRK